MLAQTLPSIDDRPKAVDKRKEIGHFEGDTIVSRESKPRLKTLNERSSGIVLIGKTKDGTTNECNRIVLERLVEFPEEYRKTLTQDRGTENFDYKQLETELKISCYFAHAYCSQERGSNENLNGLIRRFFPKGTDFSKVTVEESIGLARRWFWPKGTDLSKVSEEEVQEGFRILNSKYRKSFGYRSAREI